MISKVCAFTSICADDAGWIPQYLREVERLGMPFCIHLDRCPELAEQFMWSPMYQGCTIGNYGEFNETHKQHVLNMVVALGYDWALAWDMDETWEPDFRAKLDLAVEDKLADCIEVKLVHLWEDSGHVRVDGKFDARRDKLFNLRSASWKYLHPTVNVPYAYHGSMPVGDQGVRARRHDIVCIHWGLMTKALRQQHKERWDRVYGAAVGKNPYNFWDVALDEDIKPVLAKYDAAKGATT